MAARVYHSCVKHRRQEDRRIFVHEQKGYDMLDATFVSSVVFSSCKIMEHLLQKCCEK